MNSTALRTLMMYAIVLPLAVFIGWMTIDLASWDRTSFAMFAGILFVLLLPLILKWHYAAMVLSWNTAITIFFLPGTPTLWMLLAGINFGIAILNRIIEKRPAFVSLPSITITLLALLVVVLVTAQLRGGMGVQALGGATIGGKGYYYIIAAIIGYFALASRPIPIEKAKLYIGMFFLPGLTGLFSHLIYFAGPAFYFLFLLIPIGYAAMQASTEFGGGIVRMGGFSAVAAAVIYYLAALYGIRGILQKWWRVGLILLVIGMGTLSGFRSMLLLLGLVLVLLFAVEGLFRSAIFPMLLLAGALAMIALSIFASKLPTSTQRTLSFLPIDVDPWVRLEADSSVEWRLYMWRAMLPQLPDYFWLGKGFAINPTDMYLAEQARLRGRIDNRMTSMLAGDYHNGPLSVYVPFGFFGSLAFLAFLIVSIRALYLNYRYGAEELRTINRFLFAYFCARVIFYFFVFGALSSDLYHFTGCLGLSVALNHGVARRPASSVSRPVPLRRTLAPQASPAG